MQHSSLKCILFILSICAFTSTPAQATNQCAMQALYAAKSSLGNKLKLQAVFDKYLGEAAARLPVRRDWKTMTPTERTAQIEHARDVVVAHAKDLAAYADVPITWTGSTTAIAVVRKGGKQENRVLTVFPAGGCHFANICVKDHGCLSDLISDVRRYNH